MRLSRIDDPTDDPLGKLADFVDLFIELFPRSGRSRRVDFLDEAEHVFADIPLVAYRSHGSRPARRIRSGSICRAERDSPDALAWGRFVFREYFLGSP